MDDVRIRRQLLASVIGMLLCAGLATGAPVALAQSGGDAVAQPTQQVVFTPSKDNTIYESTDELASNGAGQHLFAGRTATPANLRALLTFDLADQVPVGSRIITVTLELNVSLTGPGDQQVALHRLTADWGEGDSDASGNEARGARATIGDATWVHAFYTDTPWGTLGGDFVGAASATANVGGAGVHSWSSPGMVTDVQNWVNVPGANFGWILVGNEVDDSSAKRFDSRQNPAAATHPRLTIVFEAAPAGQISLYLPLVQGP